MTKRYAEHTVVDGISLLVERGEVLTLVGGSGSGKTTTLKMINRLVDPSAGRVLIAGRDTREFVPHELRRTIGYVLQEVGLFPHMTVAENVGITPRISGVDPELGARRTTELLELVELEPESVSARFPHELSGGQRQRVGLARALASEPEIMLLDEPFGALDSITRKKLQRLLLRIQRARSLTAILVTHDIDEALLLGTHVAVMHQGRILQVAEPQELRLRPAHPYVHALVMGEEALAGEEGV